MAWFRLKGVKALDAHGYHFEPLVPTEVRDDDEDVLAKLRGRRGGAPHPSFEEVSAPTVS